MCCRSLNAVVPDVRVRPPVVVVHVVQADDVDAVLGEPGRDFLGVGMAGEGGAGGEVDAEKPYPLSRSCDSTKWPSFGTMKPCAPAGFVFRNDTSVAVPGEASSQGMTNGNMAGGTAGGVCARAAPEQQRRVSASAGSQSVLRDLP